MDQKAHLLLLQPPGRLRDSLLVLLQASPLIGAVDVWEGSATAPLLPETPPDILLLDVAAPAAWTEWARLHASHPPLRCCAIVHTSAQEALARAQGADVILRAGFTAEALFGALGKLAGKCEIATPEERLPAPLQRNLP